MDLQRLQTIQPPLMRVDATLTVVISSMTLGGGEWIVYDWASRIAKEWRVHLVILTERDIEWPVPKNVTVTRLYGKDILAKLQIIGRGLAVSGNPVCLAHLLSKAEQSALEAGGAFVYQVFHNAQAGWLDQPSALDRSKPVIAVSHACKRDLINAGWTGDISVIHHLPQRRIFTEETRDKWRKRWEIPTDARLIGMIGTFKPQKDYGHALRILRSLIDRGEEYYLVIIGGISIQRNREEWRRVRALIDELNLRAYVAMPGSVIDAVQCASAFDIFLNTSHYEGLSVATLEILASGIPAVVSDVGGQGEVGHTGLTIVPKEAPLNEWCDAIAQAPNLAGVIPVWVRFPAYRLWTLHHLARPYEPTDRVLFVTANLNTGGAQRSLVNVVGGFNQDQVTVAVTGNSEFSDFYRELVSAGVHVLRSAPNNDTFDNAEAIIEHVTRERIGTIVFWNTAAKLKLILSKVLGHSKVRFVDVSPGGYAFESLEYMGDFGRHICYSTRDYYERLDDLVLKFNGTPPQEFTGRVSVIPNGVPDTECVKRSYRTHAAPEVAVCGRIAPSKFLLEILDAMSIVRNKYPDAKLHIYGDASAVDRDYERDVRAHAGEHTVFHGPDFNARARYVDHDVFVTLGLHQGCPNATLEALSVGMPVVANDDGGTREQIIDGLTGRLVASVTPEEVAAAILSLLDHPDQARAMGQNGRRLALTEFSMEKMVRSYRSLLWGGDASAELEAQSA